MENKNTSVKQLRFHYIVRFAEGGIACGQTNSINAASCEAKMRARYAKRSVIAVEIRK